MLELHSIVYVSTAVSRRSDQELESLLSDAREFNAQVGVTGVLLYSGGAFFQYLEGPMDGVAQAYERIRKSRSHHSIYELLNAPIKQRLFPQWFMGFSHVPASALLRLQNAEWHRMTHQLEQARGDPNPGLALLQAYWRENEHAV